MRSSATTLKRARRLRREMTKPEVVLWLHLRETGTMGLRFRRQHPVGPYVLDFYCPSANLCIEVDGFAHTTTEVARHDERRTRWLESQGIRVLRFPAADVLDPQRRVAVLEAIVATAAPTTGFAGPPPP